MTSVFKSLIYRLFISYHHIQVASNLHSQHSLFVDVLIYLPHPSFLPFFCSNGANSLTLRSELYFFFTLLLLLTLCVPLTLPFPALSTSFFINISSDHSVTFFLSMFSVTIAHIFFPLVVSVQWYAIIENQNFCPISTTIYDSQKKVWSTARRTLHISWNLPREVTLFWNPDLSYLGFWFSNKPGAP